MPETRGLPCLLEAFRRSFVSMVDTVDDWSLSGPHDFPDPCVLERVASPPPQPLHRPTDWLTAHLLGRPSLSVSTMLHPQRLLAELNFWNHALGTCHIYLSTAVRIGYGEALDVVVTSAQCGSCGMCLPRCFAVHDARFHTTYSREAFGCHDLLLLVDHSRV